jgi:hypothetical protein
VKRRTVALAVVALVLGWRLVAAVAGGGAELSSPDRNRRSLLARFAAFDEPLAARRRRSLGFADPIFAAVEQRVPENGILVVRLKPSQRSEFFAMALYDLVWPRRIYLTGGELLDGVPPSLRESQDLYALLLTDDAPSHPEDWESVQGDRRYSLWRARRTHR